MKKWQRRAAAILAGAGICFGAGYYVGAGGEIEAPDGLKRSAGRIADSAGDAIERAGEAAQDVELPDVRMPKMRMPEVELPEVRLPELRRGRDEAGPEPRGAAADTPPPPRYDRSGDDGWPEIHSRHFFFGYPAGAPASNDMIIRRIYALSNNDDRKFADWVAFRLDRDTVTGPSVSERDWEPDPWLEENETLEPDDYRGAHAELNTDRGHQAPLAAFRGTEDWRETNYLSNITPQSSALNQGPWRILEERIRELAEDSRDLVYVMTGPLYESEFGDLPDADEDHEIPSGYWYIVCQGEDSEDVECAAFIMEQDTPRSADFLDYQVAIDEVEERSGLDFLRELPNDKEREIERLINRAWAERNLN